MHAVQAVWTRYFLRLPRQEEPAAAVLIAGNLPCKAVRAAAVRKREQVQPVLLIKATQAVALALILITAVAAAVPAQWEARQAAAAVTAAMVSQHLLQVHP